FGMADNSYRRGPDNVENQYTAPLVFGPDGTLAQSPGPRPTRPVTSGPISSTSTAVVSELAARQPINFVLPARPSTVADCGLELVLLEELTLRHIVASGTITGAELAKRLRLSLAGIVEEAVTSLRRDGLVEYQSGGVNNAMLGLAAMRLRATER